MKTYLKFIHFMVWMPWVHWHWRKYTEHTITDRTVRWFCFELHWHYEKCKGENYESTI